MLYLAILNPFERENMTLDISKLTVAELEELSNQAKLRKIEILEKEKAKILKEAKKSGSFQELKEELRSLQKEVDSMNFQFELNIPIVFTVAFEVYFDDLFSNDEVEIDSFDTTVTGYISKNNQLTKKQYSVLNPSVQEYVSDACDEIRELFPKEVDKTQKELIKKAGILINKMKKLNLTVDDILMTS